MENNVSDVALILEGGGMRGAFTAGVINGLLDNKIYFNYVAGISAGVSSTLNYLSRDRDRAKKSFIEIVDYPKFGGWKSFITGHGFFNGEYLYEEIGQPGAELPFDYETFKKNPAKFRIVAYDAINNAPKNFTNEDAHSLKDIMKMARASASLPILMPPTKYNGGIYYDGGLTGGIPIDIAIKDGYTKFFIVRTQEKVYRKGPAKYKRLVKRHFKKEPKIADTILDRPRKYNSQCELIEKLEQQGLAYVVYPEHMRITNKETNKDRLLETYNEGLNIAKRDIAKWLDFLVIK